MVRRRRGRVQPQKRDKAWLDREQKRLENEYHALKELAPGDLVRLSKPMLESLKSPGKTNGESLPGVAILVRNRLGPQFGLQGTIDPSFPEGLMGLYLGPQRFTTDFQRIDRHGRAVGAVKRKGSLWHQFFFNGQKFFVNFSDVAKVS